MENSPKTNGNKKAKYKFWHRVVLAGSLGLAALGARDGYEIHKFDKYVTKNVEIAANVPSAGRSSVSQNGLNMEVSLENARKNTNVSRLENPAIVFDTPYTSITALEDVLDKAIERSHQVQQLKDSFDSGEVSKDYPLWIKSAHERLSPKNLEAQVKAAGSNLSPEEIQKLLLLKEISASEYGQRIAYEYEALNKVVAGGTRTRAKNIQEKNRSLLDTLDKAAGWRSIIRFQGMDYKSAHAQVFVGYLMANMGDLEKGIGHFKEAKKLMDKYPDSKNLAILRDTPELSQETIKGLIDSSIKELESLDKDSSKYSAGWWKRLTYYNQSIGGQGNPSIMDLGESINGRYWTRMYLEGGTAVGLFFLAGFFGKRYKLSKKYEIFPEKEED